MQNAKKDFESTFEYKLIYVFRINDGKHTGCLKIGDATIHTLKNYTELRPNSSELNYAARQRIDSYTSTAGIAYQLLHTEVAVYKVNKPGNKNHGKILAFRDYKVHEVLLRSGIRKKCFDTNANEWFVCELSTAVEAIKAVKENKTALTSSQVNNGRSPIIFRPEQQKAIRETIKCFKSKDRMLWNAKMRFGKTLSALEVAKEFQFKKTIIITHRPVVEDGWFDDFDKIFYDRRDYAFGSKTKGKKIEELINSSFKFVYFASMQDLRGSQEVGGNFEKNEEIFSLDWDFVVVDEAHEGTQTQLGKAVLEKVIKPNNAYKTCVLELSGTPFNLLTDFESDSIYTWDYIMEQEAKLKWPLEHFGDSNPYEELPKMNIYTYHLEETLKAYIDIEDKAFNFREFFRIWTGDIKKDFARIPPGKHIGDFAHEQDIKSFLDLICKESEITNYPYSTERYRKFFRHTLWIVPGVKEARALSELLKRHHIFQHFKIVNVAGEGDEEIDTSDALSAVRNAMTSDPDNTYTITLSCGRLTTGVSVPEWTAVLMLAGSYSTAASQYLQTIFRVQTPANINGCMKENCYVFDFAPDRTLKMVAESVQLSSRAGATQPSAEIQLGKFLNFCPVISIDHTGMKEFKVSFLLQELKKAYAERVARNGFDDVKLYNDELLKLDELELKEFAKLKEIVGKNANAPSTSQIDVNNTGLTDEEYDEVQRINKKPKKERTPEELALLKEIAEKRKNRQNAISILRAISIRIPLLIYGIDKDISYEITLDSFLDSELIDDSSWAEFMPYGVTREVFKKFTKYYDKDIFVAAGRRIRFKSKTADELEPTERVIRIAELFSTFKNPDKETVLTPWNAVNLHMGETLGGYDFFREGHLKEDVLDEPRFVKRNYTGEIFKEDANILEINSKTGLYPLYVAYTLYRVHLDKIPEAQITDEKKLEVWDKVVSNNLFVVCKTDMAKKITKRTLVGYRQTKVNTHAFDDLIMQLKDKPEKLIQKLRKPSFWNKGGNKEMKFNAVVGNPPYQGVNHSQIYPFFYLSSIMIGEHVSLIFPVGWQEPKNANNLSRMNTKEVKTDKQIVFIDNRQNVFPGISGAEWTNIILWKKGYDNGLEGAQLVYTNGKNPTEVELLWEATQKPKPAEIIKLAELVKENRPFASIDAITSVRKPYGLSTDVIANSDTENYKKYHIGPLFREKQNLDDIKIYAKSGLVLYVPRNYRFPKTTQALKKYKVFIPYAWGNMSEKTGLGGAFSDIIIGSPYEVCTETYLESGCFDDFETAKKHSKYLLTKFCRALLYMNKNSQHSTTAWGAIPIQDYSESWWLKSIKEIDDELFKKYNIPEEIKQYVYNNFQTRSEDNIVNFE